jgi:hypothetical protein
MFYMKTIPVILLILILGSCASAPTQETDAPALTVSRNSHEIHIGTVDMQVNKTFGFPRLTAEVFYFPAEDAVALRYRLDFVSYNQFWGLEGREMFRNALERYLDDYENRRLDRNSRRTRTVYGTTQGFLTWQQFTFSKLHRGNMPVGLGYIFRDRSPYFTVNLRPAFHEDEFSVRNNKLSDAFTFCFTRAQARELMGLFDESLLRSLDVPQIHTRTTVIDVDYY